MSSTLNIKLTNELRRYVDQRASDEDVYSTPSEYIRDLIRRDMEAQNQTKEREIATMLVEARRTPIEPLDENFFNEERKRINKKNT